MRSRRPGRTATRIATAAQAERRASIALSAACRCLLDTVHRAPGNYPMGQEGDVLTVEFTVMGIPCIGLNGGPLFPHSAAFSFQVATDDQAETDRLWGAIIGNGGQASQCGRCKDRWGVSWQITPRALIAAIAAARRG